MYDLSFIFLQVALARIHRVIALNDKSLFVMIMLFVKACLICELKYAIILCCEKCQSSSTLCHGFLPKTRKPITINTFVVVKPYHALAK
jgi:hypothetical protein